MDALEYLYETHFETAGVRSIPRPVLEGPWRESPALYGYDAVVALRGDASGRVSLLRRGRRSWRRFPRARPTRRVPASASVPGSRGSGSSEGKPAW